MFSLLQAPWLPVRCRDGRHIRIAPWQLVDEGIIELAYPRADFQGAAYQWLIGLLQTTFAPKDENDWQRVWDQGIESALLRQALETVAPAMQFGPDKPAFMQDAAELEGEPVLIAGLLMDAPGGNTLKLNKDHFVKRGTVTGICPYCAVIALFTLQTYAPSGGQGHRTSLRGGGPMTTLLRPEDPWQPLWRKLWLNILSQEAVPASDNLPTVFPWLAPTRTSEHAGQAVTPEHAHPLQAYWGMPRRITLDFTDTRAGECDLCGEHSATLLWQYRTKNYGVQYTGWLHPLTPYHQRLRDPQAPLLSVKGQPGGLVYKEWLGLLLQREDGLDLTLPAQVVRVANQRHSALLAMPIGLWCFAYDMDNMKARCWYEHHLPVAVLPASRIEMLKAVLQPVLLFAVHTLALLRQALRQAWFRRPKNVRGDFSFIDLAYWQETQSAFSHLLHQLTDDQPTTATALLRWRSRLYRYVISTFDQQVFAHPDNPSHLEQQVQARKALGKGFYQQKAHQALKEMIIQREEKTYA